jgi:hypothetical protein
MRLVEDVFGPLGAPAPTNVRVAETPTGGAVAPAGSPASNGAQPA